MRAHILGWIGAFCLAFLQPPGQVAADTKLDLVVNPARFLARATHIFTDEFPLGQLQNQAYGYLFPQGAFFLLADLAHVPAWVTQRLWWALIMGLAFSGMVALSRRIGLPAGLPSVLPAVLYALSPRILTTLTAISSEAWPVALVPWTLVPLVQRRPNVAASVVVVACMGAVNATATIAACLPAFIYLLWRGHVRQAAGFTLGAVAVSAWWLGPLLILGRYAPPFTDFIESATVTTAWLNPVEILRGTTSWAPFVDAERTAGHLLVTEPTFVLATCAIAAVGLVGLRRLPREFVAMFALGFALLAGAHWGISLLDAQLAPFRNLHKFDALIRLPLALGVGAVVGALAARINRAQVACVVLAAVVATSPAWSLRLLPVGTWASGPAAGVSQDWVEACEYIDKHAAGTRTLVVPAASFARQEWGWTRDEPIQALCNSPFVFRDAIPLVEPEAIRGLDGQTAVVDEEALRAIGVGAVVVRRDLEYQTPTPSLGVPTANFGDVDVFLLEPARGMMITADAPLPISAGGESLPLIWRELGYFPTVLTQGDVDHRPEISTDTPALAVRNYGRLDGQSAHLADLEEERSVYNRVKDYPSAGTPVGVVMDAGGVEASSNASAARSVTSAFDNLEDTAWWPAPGDPTPRLRIHSDATTATITATANTQVLVDGRTVSLVGGEPREVTKHDTVMELELTEPVGITQVDAGVTRIVELPATDARTLVFQRHFPATDVIQRRFTTTTDATWQLTARATIDGTEHSPGPVHLPAGTHELSSHAQVVMLTQPLALPTWSPFNGTIDAADTERIIITTRGFNSGLRASAGTHELEPLLIDASTQAFIVPPGASGEFHMWHAGDVAYRASLAFGGALSLLTVAACLWVPWRRSGPAPRAQARPIAGVVVLAANPLLGAAALATAWVVERFTLIRGSWLAFGAMLVAGLWLARAPWPADNYAGDSLLLTFAGCLAIAAAAGRSTSSYEAYDTTSDAAVVNTHIGTKWPLNQGTPSVGKAK